MSESKPERTKTLGQWSAICAKSIREHLAPKGFAEIRTGVFKGAKKANIDFLSKESVDTAGRIAGGCVNHFRGRVKERLLLQVAKEKETLDFRKNRLRVIKWWEFKSKRQVEKDVLFTETYISALEDTIFELDYITIQ